MDKKLNYCDFGDMSLNECNDANIPVNCFLTAPENDKEMLEWSADNFMPRKGRCGESAYRIKAPTKEEILRAIKTYVVPLYEIALWNLQNTGTLYYWEKEGNHE